MQLQCSGMASQEKRNKSIFLTVGKTRGKLPIKEIFRLNFYKINFTSKNRSSKDFRSKT